VQRNDRGIVPIISQNVQERADMIHVKKWNMWCSGVSGQYAYKLQLLFLEFLVMIVIKKNV